MIYTLCCDDLSWFIKL